MFPHGSENFELGRYDIDRHVFPCRFMRADETDDKRYADFAIKLSHRHSPMNFEIGPFKSNEEAKKFKHEFEYGQTRLNLKFGCDVTVRSRIERVTIKEGGYVVPTEKKLRMWRQVC